MSARRTQSTARPATAPRPRSLQHPAVAFAVGLTALAPFAQPVGTIDPYTARFAGILLAACAWLWAWVLEHDAFRAPRRVILAAGAVGAATLASALASGSPGPQLTWGAEGGYMSVPVWLALLAVFACAASVRPSAEVASVLRLVFAWGAVAAVMVIWERAGSAPQVTGGFGNANYAGAALVSLVPLALFYANHEPEPRYRPWWRYFVIALVAAVVLAGSLANIIALVAVGAGVCLFAPATLLGIDRRTGRRIAIALAALLLLAALAAGVALGTDILPKGLDGLISDRVLGPTALTRLEMWKMALGIFGEHPLLGAGPSGVQLASQGHLTERLLALESGSFIDYRILMKDPHSLPLLALATLGLAGMATLLWLAAEWLRALRPLLAPGSAEARSTSLRLALALGVGGGFTAMLFMPWAVSFGPLVPLLAGLAIAGSASDDAATPARTLPAAVKLGATALATLLAAWLVGAAVYGQSQVGAATGESSPEAARDRYAAAARVQPWRPYVAYEALYAQGFLASEGLASLPEYRAAVDAAPADVLANAGFLANLVQPSLDEAYLTGRTDLAWEQARVERAAKLAPNHPEVVLEQAHVALLAGDLDEARTLLERAERFSPNAPRFLVYRYYLALATGDTATAAEYEPRIEASGPGHARLMKGWDR